jgi:hypothetical protein
MVVREAFLKFQHLNYFCSVRDSFEHHTFPREWSGPGIIQPLDNILWSNWSDLETLIISNIFVQEEPWCARFWEAIFSISRLRTLVVVNPLDLASNEKALQKILDDLLARRQGHLIAQSICSLQNNHQLDIFFIQADERVDGIVGEISSLNADNISCTLIVMPIGYAADELSMCQDWMKHMAIESTCVERLRHMTPERVGKS